MYNGGWYGHPDFKLSFPLPDWAPEYTASDVEAYMRGVRWGGEQLAAKTASLDPNDLGTDFKVPIIFLQGRYDLHTPYESARQCFETLRSPHKRFITFERSAHFPMFEEAGRFLVTLVKEVLPLTTERATFKLLPQRLPSGAHTTRWRRGVRVRHASPREGATTRDERRAVALHSG